MTRTVIARSTVLGRSARAQEVHLRPGRLADAVACAAVMRAAIRALPPTKGLSPGARAAWSSLPPLYHRWAMGPGGEAYLVAERLGRIVGFAARSGEELTAAFVRPAEQGRGTGRRLVLALARAAGREGALGLRVLAALPAAGFYGALGFTRRGPARVALPGGPALAAVRMRLPLRGAGS
jgi:GNAT superfamily N-acetyltransferase